MKTPAGRTYRSEWRRLATYLADQWPGTRCGSSVETAITLLEHLRAVEEGGLLPAYDINGTLVPSVAQLVQQRGVLGEAAVRKVAIREGCV